MKSRMSYYPNLRKELTDIDELCGIINRSYSYCSKRMAGKKDFTHREKVLICKAMGVDDRKCEQFCHKTEVFA